MAAQGIRHSGTRLALHPGTGDLLIGIWQVFYKHNQRWGPMDDPLELILASLRSRDFENLLFHVKMIRFEIVNVFGR